MFPEVIIEFGEIASFTFISELIFNENKYSEWRLQEQPLDPMSSKKCTVMSMYSSHTKKRQFLD